MFDPTDLPPEGTENVTVVHLRGDRRITTTGTLTEVDIHLGGFALWLSVPVGVGPTGVTEADFSIDAHRIVSVSVGPSTSDAPNLPTMDHVLGYFYGAAVGLLRSVEKGWPIDSEVTQLREGVAAYERLNAERAAELDARTAVSA